MTFGMSPKTFLCRNLSLSLNMFRHVQLTQMIGFLRTVNMSHSVKTLLRSQSYKSALKLGCQMRFQLKLTISILLNIDIAAISNHKKLRFEFSIGLWKHNILKFQMLTTHCNVVNACVKRLLQQAVRFLSVSISLCFT